MVERTQFHYADIKLNEHWYNTSKDKLNKEDNQQLFTKQIESTNVETVDTKSNDEDTELVEEQAAVDCRQELTGDPLPSVVQFENLENQVGLNISQ